MKTLSTQLQQTITTSPTVQYPTSNFDPVMGISRVNVYIAYSKKCLPFSKITFYASDTYWKHVQKHI